MAMNTVKKCEHVVGNFNGNKVFVYNERINAANLRYNNCVNILALYAESKYRTNAILRVPI